jgi:hypothetical protein
MPSKEQLDAVAEEIKALLLKEETNAAVRIAAGQFIDEINNTAKPDTCRLLLCIGIDLHSGAVQPADVCAIIVKTLEKRIALQEKCKSFPDDRKPGLLAALGNVIRETNSKSIFKSNFAIDRHDQYVQVVSTSKLIPHVFDQAQGKLSEDNKRIYTNRLFQRRTIPISRWKQDHSTVFVVHREDYLVEAKNGIDHVLDALGVEANLTEVIDGEYVALFYSDDFESAFFQPCTFHGNWGSFDEIKSTVNNPNPFFICYINEDGYGRTHSTSGKKRPARERVHPGFTKAPRVYQFRYERHPPVQTSIYQNNTKRNPEEAVDEAYRRYLLAKK